MAARKSCTHMTWAEAKAKSGGDAAPALKSKGTAPKKLNHAEKIIAKNGVSKEAIAKERRKEKRFEERAAAISKKRAEERLQQRLSNQKVKPSEQARAHMSELASKEQQQAETTPLPANACTDLSDLQTIAQCKEMQLNEIMALEAIFGEEEAEEDSNANKVLVSNFSRLEELREKVESYQDDEENESVLQSLVKHPPISLLLPLTIHDSNQIFSSSSSVETELVASVLLRVTLPPTYPLMTESSSSSSCTPQFEIVYFMVTDLHTVCSADKPLLSLVHLDKTKLLEAIQTEATQILPDLCVYEIGVTWLTENLFQDDFIEVIKN